MKEMIVRIGLGLFLMLFMTTLATAYFPPIENGISWLTTTQNVDGSWGSNTDLIVLDTTTVLDTMKILNVSSSAYSNGIIWLSSQTPLSNDFLSRKIVSLYSAGADISTDLATLVNRKNSDGGWSGDDDPISMVFDTALVLRMLKTVNYPDQNLISSGIEYLKTAQNPDGGWGFYKGDESNVYMTALVLSLAPFPSSNLFMIYRQK